MEARLAVLEATVPRIDAALQKIANSLESLARLESNHQAMNEGLGRAFKAIKDLEDLAEKRSEKIEAEIEKIEAEMPTMKLARSVVMWFGSACMAVVVSYILYRAGLLMSGGNGLRLPPPP